MKGITTHWLSKCHVKKAEQLLQKAHTPLEYDQVHGDASTGGTLSASDTWTNRLERFAPTQLPEGARTGMCESQCLSGIAVDLIVVEWK
jgi:hypothetical protein